MWQRSVRACAVEKVSTVISRANVAALVRACAGEQVASRRLAVSTNRHPLRRIARHLSSS
jgi:hypothetical protein